MIKGQKKTELLFYLAIWAILYIAPILSLYIGKVSIHASQFDWRGLFNAWSLLSMFFVTFCVHNFIIAPMLVYRNSKWLYGAFTCLLMCGFMFYQMNIRPHRPNDVHHPQRPTEQIDYMNETEPHRPTPPKMDNEFNHPKPHRNITREPPRAFGGQDSVAFIIISLLLGLNVATKYYFKSLNDKKRIQELERDNLNTQLAYLKYQINPHFFMNTLNNIHALVLIDPEQANRMIETLSKLMRYVLYDGKEILSPLQKEIAFIKNYVELMRIRYTEHVKITLDLPDTAPDIKVPSLLFATFIENAFKHGVSYENKSFIYIVLRANEENVTFSCKNSCNNTKTASSNNKQKGGVGLANARKRLDLLYGKDYEMVTMLQNNEYNVNLHIPFKKQ